MNTSYCKSLTSYNRRQTIEVTIGDIPMGGDNPIRVQSMTTVDTMDTAGSIEQCIRMIESGCEYIRITAPNIKEARNLKNIKDGLKDRGYNTPLVADIHFTPNAAEEAARLVEKVRINPGNFVDKKKFDLLEYTDEEYQQELIRIEEKFVPLLNICKENNTALRVGTNHGSLSDRIMSKYGDTPLGMVESALEFLRICNQENFHNVVVSMKSSNPLVMVQAYRMLVTRLEEEKLPAYPLHLGVTEAGDGEDGRIKSAVGIGTLLEDGLGDTVRVSLTEEPEKEAPVAQKLINQYIGREKHASIHSPKNWLINPFEYKRFKTLSIENIGGENVPVVLVDLSKIELNAKTLKTVGHHYLPELDKWSTNDIAADYIYVKDDKNINFELPGTIRAIVDVSNWKNEKSYPLFSAKEYNTQGEVHPKLNFVKLSCQDIIDITSIGANTVILLHSTNLNEMAALRASSLILQEKGISNPIIFLSEYKDKDLETFQIESSTNLGGLFVDGLGDGVFISYDNTEQLLTCAFGILQAARTRITKTEYISCPSCGRTLFDLQETTAKIRNRTSHLKGLKIGIMGCIVNGPGEMADADYGYVGSGHGKITLYRCKEVVKKGVPSENAVDELINIIKEDGKWINPEIN